MRADEVFLPRANVGRFFALASCSALVSEIDVVRRRASLAYSSPLPPRRCCLRERSLRARAYSRPPSLAKSSVLGKVDKINLKINLEKLKKFRGKILIKIFTPGRGIDSVFRPWNRSFSTGREKTLPHTHEFILISESKRRIIIISNCRNK